MQPDALPVRLARSVAVLAPDAVAALFGKGYALKGSEHVTVLRSSQHAVSVAVEAGKATQIVLGGLDRHALGDGPPPRLRGPKGSLDAPEIEKAQRALVLPAGLVGAWRLRKGQRVTIQAGAVAFGNVVVEEGQPAHVRLCPADALAAGLEEGDPVRWNPHLDIEPSTVTSAPASDPKVRATGRLITENDVRQARLHHQTILVRDGQIVTPAARSLGRELGILRDA